MIRVVRAGVLWSKRYPSRSAYIFFNGTMAGSGGISKVGTALVLLPSAIILLRWFCDCDWRVEMITWRFIADLSVQTARAKGVVRNGCAIRAPKLTGV